MVDPDLLALKASSVRRHLLRARSKAGTDLAQFEADLDRQDIVILNLQQAIQNCVDIAAHIVAENDLEAFLAHVFRNLGLAEKNERP